MRMLARGLSQAEVTRQTAITWAWRLAEDPQAWRRRPLGRPAALGQKDRARRAKLVLQGAMVNGFPTEL
jgi:hypothetical protein